MPERPDLDYVVPRLGERLAGATIVGVRVKKPVVLRVAVPGAIETLLTGQTIQRVSRRAHFVLFALTPAARGRESLEIVVSPMLAGRFAIADASDRSPGDLAVGLALADGRELRYRDDVQMGKFYVIAAGAHDKVPGLKEAAAALDVLDEKVFTRAAFRALARKRRDQVKVFLMDKSALDAMGNAYADEVLFAAGLHPKTMVRSLDDAALDRLHDAIVDVLAGAAEEIVRRAPPLDEKVRDFLKVRNRHGEPCPRCGAKLRKAGVHGHDAFFCPQCQPATRGGIVDWRKV